MQIPSIELPWTQRQRDLLLGERYKATQEIIPHLVLATQAWAQGQSYEVSYEMPPDNNEGLMDKDVQDKIKRDQDASRKLGLTLARLCERDKHWSDSYITLLNKYHDARSQLVRYTGVNANDTMINEEGNVPGSINEDVDADGDQLMMRVQEARPADHRFPPVFLLWETFVIEQILMLRSITIRGTCRASPEMQYASTLGHVIRRPALILVVPLSCTGMS